MSRKSTLVRFSRDLMMLGAFAVPVLAAMTPRTARADEPAPAGPPAPVAPSSPAAPAPVSAPGASAPASTVVQLDADDHRATIERRVGTQSPSGMPLLETGLFSVGQWEHACVSPCTAKLDARYAYRVAGDGLVPTDSFSLPRSGDRVRIDARMGSSTGRLAGVALTGGGILALGAGALALVATPILHSEDVGSEGFRTGVLAGGVGAVSLGAIAVGVGTLLWLTNGSTAHAQVASR
jgi:hypothetical protein